MLGLCNKAIIGCDAATVKTHTNSKIQVNPCGFDYDIDNYYCTVDKINLYKSNIGHKIDFDKDYTIVKINDGKYVRLVAINQKNKKVYPLNYQISKKNSQFDYSENKDSICIVGDFYGYQNTYNNSKICFKIIDGVFIKTNISENLVLKNKLHFLKNDERRDYKDWTRNIENKCAKKKSYTLGEGAALIREGCYNAEYTNRLKNISTNKSTTIKEINTRNEDGLRITLLPYNSDDHINCLLKNNNVYCNKVNLIDIGDLSKVYNFIDESNGASVIFPETDNGVILIASPSSSDSGTPLINLISVNALGLTKKISLDASKNILINKNYEISYMKNGKPLKIILNKNGEFIK